MVEINKVESLLYKVNKIVQHKRDIERLKGERFNVFSILQMEKAENKTHSAFLSELLNPKGSHLKGNVFLRLFLQYIGNNTVDITTAKVKTEHFIGARDDVNKTGGRIDIYIWDDNKNCISIENKIDAGDQYAQIERYSNHNKNKNQVFYLNKYGDDPSVESKGNLVSDIDFKIISYQKDIVEWLQQCLKESVDTPILRETIKQYIILIKKITNTMDKKEQGELIDLILKNAEESSFIASNYNNARHKIAETIRLKVYDLLCLELKDRYLVYKGNDASKVNSQIWIKPIQTSASHLYFGVESFSGDGFYKDIVIGVFNQSGKRSGFADIDGHVHESNWWMNVSQLDSLEDIRVNFSNPNTISKIHSDEKFRTKFINHIVLEIIKYLDCNTEALVSYINREK